VSASSTTPAYSANKLLYLRQQLLGLERLEDAVVGGKEFGVRPEPAFS
jgi:hypothetical protein